MVVFFSAHLYNVWYCIRNTTSSIQQLYKVVHPGHIINQVVNTECKKLTAILWAFLTDSTCVHAAMWTGRNDPVCESGPLEHKKPLCIICWEEEWGDRGVACGAEGGVSDLLHNQPDDLIHST